MRCEENHYRQRKSKKCRKAGEGPYLPLLMIQIDAEAIDGRQKAILHVVLPRSRFDYRGSIPFRVSLPFSPSLFHSAMSAALHSVPPSLFAFFHPSPFLKAFLHPGGRGRDYPPPDLGPCRYDVYPEGEGLAKIACMNLVLIRGGGKFLNKQTSFQHGLFCSFVEEVEYVLRGGFAVVFGIANDPNSLKRD